MKKYLVIIFCVMLGLNYSLISQDDTEALEISQADQQADANDELDKLDTPKEEPKTEKEVKPQDLEEKPAVTKEVKPEKKAHAKKKKIAKHKAKKEIKAKKKAAKKNKAKAKKKANKKKINKKQTKNK